MSDPYVLENNVLKNKLGITDYTELRDAEKDIAYVKLLNLEEVSNGEYNIELIKNIHKHIFEDVFEWAGEFRTIPIEKRELIIPGVSLEYSQPKDIEKKLYTILEEMNSFDWDKKSTEEIVPEFTGFLAKIWRVHPFRDGNTRTTLAFADIFAKEHGFEMDMSTMLNQLYRIQEISTGKVLRWSIRDKFVLASLDEDDKPEPKALQQAIKQSINKGKKKSSKSKNDDEGR